jgi:hypothetical protein
MYCSSSRLLPFDNYLFCICLKSDVGFKIKNNDILLKGRV